MSTSAAQTTMNEANHHLETPKSIVDLQDNQQMDADATPSMELPTCCSLHLALMVLVVQGLHSEWEEEEGDIDDAVASADWCS